MIRYPTTVASLEAAAEAEKRGWRAKAAVYTRKCGAKKSYVDQGSIWGEVKGVYMRLQHNKCVYCERKLASLERVNPDGSLEMIGPGSVEHDVEHFRPKSSVKVWPSPKIAKSRNIHYNFGLGKESAKGYYLLAYHLLNYATSCKTCNTPLKSNYFPVEKPRKVSVGDPAKLAAEEPLLIYPLGTIDDDPEKLIAFDGWLPRPVASAGRDFRRALVTIDFFELDTREELIRERAERIVSLYMAFTNLKGSSSNIKDIAKRSVVSLTAASAAHASCSRSYLKVLRGDSARAAKIAELAQKYLDSQS